MLDRNFRYECWGTPKVLLHLFLNKYIRISLIRVYFNGFLLTMNYLINTNKWPKKMNQSLNYLTIFQNYPHYVGVCGSQKWFNWSKNQDLSLSRFYHIMHKWTLTGPTLTLLGIFGPKIGPRIHFNLPVVCSPQKTLKTDLSACNKHFIRCLTSFQIQHCLCKGSTAPKRGLIKPNPKRFCQLSSVFSV